VFARDFTYNVRGIEWGGVRFSCKRACASEGRLHGSNSSSNNKNVIVSYSLL
jgi:hypothetical protein